MKTLHIPFEDKEFEQIKEYQEESGLTWRNLCLKEFCLDKKKSV